VFHAPVCFNPSNDILVTIEWETVAKRASIDALEKRNIFSLIIRKLRTKACSWRKFSENFVQDFHPLIRIVSRQRMCVTYIIHSMAVNCASSMNKRRKQVSV
jgi:hypothetical protein